MQIIKLGGPKQTEPTVLKTTSDTSRTLSTISDTIKKTQDSDIGGQPMAANGAYITIETNTARVGIGTVTTTVGHLVGPGDVVLLESQHEIDNTEFISAVAGLAADLQITMQYFR